MSGPAPSRGEHEPVGDGGSSDTRERLLDAAEDLFVRKGYAGTSVRDIVAAAGCNLAAVNYHFGGKHKLYEEVLRRRLGVMREQRLAAVASAARAAGGGGDLEATLRAYAETFLAPLQEDPEGQHPLRLMLREIVDPLLPQDFFRRELILPVNRALAAAVTRTAPELSEREARLCVQSFVGQLLHAMHARRFAFTDLEDSGDALSIVEIADHIVRFTVAGVARLRHEPGPRPGRSRPVPADRPHRRDR